MDNRTKVVILGAGCGAMSAAFWLSATEELRNKYKVTVYTQGWRLGGKGASGRNRHQHDRIEEHGLHMMLGFYDTVFYVMRSCYRNMDKNESDAFQKWDEAFGPQRQITLWNQWPPKEKKFAWHPWNVRFPKMPGTPGDEKLSLEVDVSYMNQAIHGVLELLLSEAIQEIKLVMGDAHWWERELESYLETMAQKLIRPIEEEFDFFLQHHQTQILNDLIEFQTWFKDNIGPRAKTGEGLDGDSAIEAYRIYLIVEVGLAGLAGFLSDILPYGEAGYQRINDQEYKDWLKSHKADPEAAESALVMCLYDLAFAYENGNSSDPKYGKAAAGAFVRLLIRMAFTYKDAPLWKMHAGMGDIIFTPLYKVLLKNNVEFKFFHRLTALHTSPDHKDIDKIEFDVQVKINGKHYDPVSRVNFSNGKSWDCWPSEPIWSQIQNGDWLEKQGYNFEDPWTTYHVDTSKLLRKDGDFDLVILAIPPAASESATEELKSSKRWADMIDNTTSVPTQSVQLWLSPDLAGLGWKHGPTVSTTYVHALKSWGEMSQVLLAEPWPPKVEPHSCEYLCGTYQPSLSSPSKGKNAPEYQRGQNEEIGNRSQHWLSAHCQPLWPDVLKRDGSLNPKYVLGQYCRANVAYSELYVQSFPGSISFRLKPGESGFDNLYLAGDWTVTSINGGCAEAAFESGMHAASAITGKPPPEV